MLPANGVLSADAVFQVALNGAAPVAVTVARQAGNTTRAQLITNINTALTSAGLTGVSATLVSNKLQFKAAGDMFGASISVFVSNPLTNTAKTETTPMQTPVGVKFVSFLFPFLYSPTPVAPVTADLVGCGWLLPARQRGCGVSEL